jgi:hypothetical protein
MIGAISLVKVTCDGKAADLKAATGATAATTSSAAANVTLTLLSEGIPQAEF